ncbi:MAG: hypothetical protein ING75_09165 [Rhodocyclaceae bacterium]|nr:hypothetical protein [Rhodocyclaceae bacterium]
MPQTLVSIVVMPMSRLTRYLDMACRRYQQLSFATSVMSSDKKRFTALSKEASALSSAIRLHHQITANCIDGLCVTVLDLDTCRREALPDDVHGPEPMHTFSVTCSLNLLGQHMSRACELFASISRAPCLAGTGMEAEALEDAYCCAQFAAGSKWPHALVIDAELPLFEKELQLSVKSLPAANIADDMLAHQLHVSKEKFSPLAVEKVAREQWQRFDRLSNVEAIKGTPLQRQYRRLALIGESLASKPLQILNKSTENTWPH